MEERVDHSQATMIFVVGLVSVLCVPLLGFVAWNMGTTYVNTCIVEGVEPKGLGVAGKYLGIAGVCLFFFYLLLGCAGAVVSIALQA